MDHGFKIVLSSYGSALLLWAIDYIFTLNFPEKQNEMKKHSKKILIYTTLKNNFMKINLYKALPILLISADLLIYIIAKYK
jgi:hypothetical protein